MSPKVILIFILTLYASFGFASNTKVWKDPNTKIYKGHFFDQANEKNIIEVMPIKILENENEKKRQRIINKNAFNKILNNNHRPHLPLKNLDDLRKRAHCFLLHPTQIIHRQNSIRLNTLLLNG